MVHMFPHIKKMTMLYRLNNVMTLKAIVFAHIREQPPSPRGLLFCTCAIISFHLGHVVGCTLFLS